MPPEVPVTPDKSPVNTRLFSWTVAAGIAFSITMIAARLGVLQYGMDTLDRVYFEIPKALFAGVYDVKFMLCVTLVALIAIWLFRKRRGLRRLTFAIYLAFGAFTLGASIANIQVVTMQSRPFTYQWMYYSDFVFSNEAWQAIKPSLTPQFNKFIAAEFVGAIGLTLVGLLVIRILQRFLSNRELRLITIPVLLLYLWLGQWYMTVSEWPVEKTVNPVVAFSQSVIEAWQKPPLMSIVSPFNNDDFARVGERTTVAARPATQPAVPIKNVVFFVLESTGARYMNYFGGEFDVTPNLERYRSQSAAFDKVYALTPSTNSTMLSLLCSTYSWPSYKSVFNVRPNAGLDCFSQTMKARGNRTAFFSSAELAFGNASAFLKEHGFDLQQDWRDRKHVSHLFKSEWTYLYGSSDGDTVDSLIDWIGQDKPQAADPFFAVLWTIQAHYPYYMQGRTKQFTKDYNLNRYLTAVAEADYALGRFLDYLKKAGLADSTLVVVLGDHGEAFAQHGTFGHGTAIYEENISIPLVLINSQLFHGETYHSLGGTVDVVPTVAECLNIPDRPMWQGHSLLSGQHPDRMYFVQPYSDLQFGFREGNKKMIFNAWRDVTEVYDLSADPGEKNNIAATEQAFITTAKQRLASWTRYQNDFYARSFNVTAPAPTDRLATGEPAK